MIRVTRIREFLATLAALLLIVAFAAGVAMALGKRIPILSDITDALGLT